MKLLAFAPRATDDARGSTQPRVGALTERGIRDLTARLGVRDLIGLIEAGHAAVQAGEETGEEELVDPDTVDLLAPLPAPGKIVCVARNYHDHCREMGVEPPSHPVFFAKFANAIAAPGMAVVRPRITEQLDLECELAAIIGRRTSRIGHSEALDHVFGYTILNDVTARDLQDEDFQWVRAKGADGFAPVGPVVVTADEIADPQRLFLCSAVNGETWQDSSTAEMVFDVATLVAFVSRSITLEPGDLLATGTPAGVGRHQRPPRYLHGGDVMRCEIEGIGALENPVVDEEPRATDHATAAGVSELLGGRSG